MRGAFSDRYRDAAGLPKDTPIIIVLKEGVHDQNGTFGVSTRRSCGAARGRAWSASSAWPDALGARLCVLDDVVGDVVAGFGTEKALEHFEGCTGSLQ